MNPNLFRKVALERLSSPERLDSLMEVVNLKAWIALLGCGLVLLAGLLWGVLGSLSDEVNGAGILSREGGVFNVDAAGPGELARVLVHPNDTVIVGELLAIVGRPELEERIRDAEAQREALARQREAALPLLAQETGAQLEAIRARQSQLKETAMAARERIAYLTQQVAALKQALDKGLIIPDFLQNSRQQLAEAEEKRAGTESRGHELASETAALESKLAQRRFDFDQELRKVQGRIEELRAQRDRESRVLSPFAGRILELLKDPGQIIPTGATLMRMEINAAPVVCYLLVPAEGKRLRPGMAVQMEPAGIRQEEYGLMCGRVRRVSQSPLSNAGIETLLQNPQLAAQLGGKGNAYLVEVLPEFDPGTPSGFRWTSRAGPPQTFGSGTLLNGRIQVRSQAPITLVLPAIKKWLRG